MKKIVCFALILLLITAILMPTSISAEGSLIFNFDTEVPSASSIVSGFEVDFDTTDGNKNS